MASAHGMTHAQVEDLIRCTTDSNSKREDYLTLPDANARVVVNSLQRVRADMLNPVLTLAECLRHATSHQWLDSTVGDISRTAERRRAIRLLVDLAARSGQVPDGHYLTGVKYDPLVPTWFGAFSDVHEGTWCESSTFNRVVVKRLRVNEGPEQRVIQQVRRHSSSH
jgi:hypothetical protein